MRDENPSEYVSRYLGHVERQARTRRRLGWASILVGVAFSIDAGVRILMWPAESELPPPFIGLFLGLVLIVGGAMVVRRA